MELSPKPRCGTRLHKGKEVPLNAVIKTHNGRECYLSGLDDSYKYVRYLDNDEILKYPLSKSLQ